jgi:PPOX class probable F420-dependent enzyme
MAISPEQRAFLQTARTAILATVAPDGAPRLVPICFVLDGDRVVSALDEKPKRTADPRDLARVRDILARPRVSLLVHRWDEDWSRLAWVRLHGIATLIEPGLVPLGVVEELRAKYPQYEDHAIDRRPLLSVGIDRVSSWGNLEV